MSMKHRKLVSDGSKLYLFLAKYLHIYMYKDSRVWVVTQILMKSGKWHAGIELALKHQYDVRKYCCPHDTQNSDDICWIDCTKLSKYIKAFNKGMVNSNH